MMTFTEEKKYEVPNYDGFVVIGAGLPRTGTSSLRVALGLLLKGACYHMKSISNSKASDPDVPFWNRVLSTKPTKEEWLNFFQRRGYRAGVDYPVAKFYKEIMDAYPKAKVILTIRDPEKWYESVKNTIYKALTLGRDPLFRIYSRFLGIWDQVHCGLQVCHDLFESIENGQEESERFFNNWVTEVKASVPEDRLLVFSVKEGWGPLCEFLDLPKPEGPFPRCNDTMVFNKQSRLNRVKVGSRIWLVLIQFMLAVTASFLYYYC